MAEEIGAPPEAPSPDSTQFHEEQLGVEEPNRPPAKSSAKRSTKALDDQISEAEQKPIRCAKFRQQELWAWKPVWSPQVVIIMYIIVSIIFIPLGVVILVQSSSLYSSSLLRYDANSCAVGNETTADTPPNICTIRLEITKDIVSQPSYFYYGITNFYQNARTYVSSRSSQQLRNDSDPDTSTCDPLETFPDNDTVINPCGLAANSQFNDTFQLCRDINCNQPVSLNGTNIAWRVDRESRFIPGTSEDFIVWMRLAAYNTWKKLYRRIEEDLQRGTYWVRIESRFPVSGFGGKKFFFISETTWFGGPNQPLAISYIVVGCISLIIAIFFAIKSRISQDLELPPETTVYLKGLVKHPLNPAEAVRYPTEKTTV